MSASPLADLFQSYRIIVMTTRNHNDHDVFNTSNSSGDCAPLSKYLQTGVNDDEWTIVSSDSEQQTQPVESAPNLSVLKSLKRFLSTETQQESAFFTPATDAANYRVDYPFYDGEPQNKSQSVPESETLADFITPIPNAPIAQNKDEYVQEEEEEEELEYRFVEEALISPDAIVYVRNEQSIDVPASEDETTVEEPLSAFSSSNPPLENKNPQTSETPKTEVQNAENVVQEEPIVANYVEEENETTDPEPVLEAQTETREVKTYEEAADRAEDVVETDDVVMSETEDDSIANVAVNEEDVDAPQEEVTKLDAAETSEVAICTQSIDGPFVVDFGDLAEAAFERLEQGVPQEEDPLVVQTASDRKRARRANSSQTARVSEPIVESVQESAFIRRDIKANSRLTIFHRFVDLLGKHSRKEAASQAQTNPTVVHADSNAQTSGEYGETVAFAIAPFVMEANTYCSLDSFITPQ